MAEPHQPPPHPQEHPPLHPPLPTPPPQQHPPDTPPSSPVPASHVAPSELLLLQQARIGAVLYDIFVRGDVPTGHTFTHLLCSFPSAAEVAADYAFHTRVAMASLPAYSAALNTTSYLSSAPSASVSPSHTGPRDFVLHRVSAPSIAWFCFFAGALIATLRLCFIFSLVFLATLAHAAEHTFAYHVIDYIAAQSLGDGPFRELYRWLFALLTEQNPVVIFGDTPGMPQADWIPSYLTAALMVTPLSVGIVCFVLGGLAAFTINTALRAAGGIRFENRHD